MPFIKVSEYVRVPVRLRRKTILPSTFDRPLINRPWKRSDSAWLYDTIRFDYESSIECTISFDKKRSDFWEKKKRSTIKDNVTGTRERKVENGNPFSGWVALRFSKEMVAYVSVPTCFTTVALRPSKYLIRALRGRRRRLHRCSQSHLPAYLSRFRYLALWNF